MLLPIRPLVVAACLVPGLHPLAGQDPAPKSGVIGVIGKWSEVMDESTPVVLVRDSRDQTPSTADLERVSRALFRRVDASFLANGSAPGAFSLAILPNTENFAGGTFEARFKLVSGATDQTAGLVFDLRPSGEYKYVRYNTKDGDVALWRFAQGQRHLIVHGKEHAQLPLNAWHELSLTVAGTKL